MFHNPCFLRFCLKKTAVKSSFIADSPVSVPIAQLSGIVPRRLNRPFFPANRIFLILFRFFPLAFSPRLLYDNSRNFVNQGELFVKSDKEFAWVFADSGNNFAVFDWDSESTDYYDFVRNLVIDLYGLPSDLNESEEDAAYCGHCDRRVKLG